MPRNKLNIVYSKYKQLPAAKKDVEVKTVEETKPADPSGIQEIPKPIQTDTKVPNSMPVVNRIVIEDPKTVEEKIEKPEPVVEPIKQKTENDKYIEKLLSQISHKPAVKQGRSLFDSSKKPLFSIFFN